MILYKLLSKIVVSEEESFVIYILKNAYIGKKIWR